MLYIIPGCVLAKGTPKLMNIILKNSPTMSVGMVCRVTGDHGRAQSKSWSYWWKSGVSQWGHAIEYNWKLLIFSSGMKKQETSIQWFSLPQLLLLLFKTNKPSDILVSSMCAEKKGVQNFPVHNMGVKQKSLQAASASLPLTGWIWNLRRQNQQSHHSASNPSEEQTIEDLCSFISVMLLMFFLSTSQQPAHHSTESPQHKMHIQDNHLPNQHHGWGKWT